MKLLLINSYLSGDAWHYPPLELGFLATFVRDRSSSEVKLVDPAAENMDINQVVKAAKDFDIVGLNCFTERRVQCFEIAKRIKEENPNCKIILGGPHATALDIKIMEHYTFVDGIIRSEGEQTLLEVVKGGDYKKILGLTWRNNGEIIKNPDRPLMENLDDVYVDYSFLPPMKKYIRDYASPDLKGKINYVYMLSSRGCPFFCEFCGNKFFWRSCWRAPNPEILVRRMSDLVGEYGVEYFRFGDGEFTANETWSRKFCKELQNAKLDIHFRVDSRINVSAETLKDLKKSGCVGVTFGIESFSDEILTDINKYTRRNMIIETLKNSRKAGLWTRGTFILLWPGETVENFKRNTLRFTGFVDEFEAHVLHILPGTPLYERLKQKGEINDEMWFNIPDRKRFYCKENFPSALYSLDELEKVFWYANNYFTTRNPRKIMKKFDFIRSMILMGGSALNMGVSGIENFVNIDGLLKFEKKYYIEFQKKMLKSGE
jgi:magnesium-protoporphyrin IX monomethyl ester (oxidative) cyclase